jgi:DNA-binding CsgD family transcriptional regulator/tetratricopeptide (TPR) repeat protein
MHLLERESQIQALAEYALEADAGQGRLVLVSGEAGVGKSSLLEQLEGSLSGARWFWGACDGLFTPRPLAPLLDIATQLGGELSTLCRAGAPREDLFAELLHQMKQPGDLQVFAVEDVHWADEATLDLLRFLGRRLRDTRSLILVTYRDEGLAAGDPLRVALGDLATQRTTRRVSLPRLSAQAVAVLADGTGLEPAQLFALTGGNPFFLSELLQHQSILPGDGELPTSARDAVLAHVSGLSHEARQVLDVAALTGARVEPLLLLAITKAAPAAVDELIACGVLTGDGDLLRFRHEIARLAVEQAIGVHRRAPVHRGILEALRVSGCTDEARLAFHAEGAGDGELVLVHAPSAARRASALASHRVAVAQYERALRFASGADDRTTAALYDALAYEASLVDRWQDSADAAEAALGLWRAAGDPRREGDSLSSLARAMWRLCRGDEANRAVTQALAVLEPLGPSSELAWAFANLASRRMQLSEHTEAIELARRAQSLAEVLGLPDVRSDALNTHGCATAQLGGDWERLLRQALDIALTHGQHEHAGRAYANLYAMYCSELRFAEGESSFVDGVAYCDEHDISTFGTCLRGERTATLEKLGSWDEATSLSGRLLEQVASPVNRLNPLIALGKVRARRDAAGVWECLDEAASAADGVAEPQWIVPARLARAEAHWLDVDIDAASREISLAEAVVPTCGVLDRSEVAAWRHRISGAGRPHPQIVEPYASQVAGDHARAARLWDDLSCPYHAALALLDATDEVLLRQALTRMEGLGAVAAARAVRRKMRDLGIRSIPSGARSTTRENPAGLTRREREVLVLICDGHTNEEISNRLFISTKTVDHHVSAVLGKLGVPSRRVAAGEAVRLGLVDDRT